MKLAIFTDCFSVKFAPKFATKLTVVSTNLLLKILGNLTFFCQKCHINPSEIGLDCKCYDPRQALPFCYFNHVYMLVRMQLNTLIMLLFTDKTCYGCGETGHISKNCNNKKCKCLFGLIPSLQESCRERNIHKDGLNVHRMFAET